MTTSLWRQSGGGIFIGDTGAFVCDDCPCYTCGVCCGSGGPPTELVVDLGTYIYDTPADWCDTLQGEFTVDLIPSLEVNACYWEYRETSPSWSCDSGTTTLEFVVRVRLQYDPITSKCAWTVWTFFDGGGVKGEDYPDGNYYHWTQGTTTHDPGDCSTYLPISLELFASQLGYVSLTFECDPSGVICQLDNSLPGSICTIDLP